MLPHAACTSARSTVPVLNRTKPQNAHARARTHAHAHTHTHTHNRHTHTHAPSAGQCDKVPQHGERARRTRRGSRGSQHAPVPRLEAIPPAHQRPPSQGRVGIATGVRHWFQTWSATVAGSRPRPNAPSTPASQQLARSSLAGQSPPWQTSGLPSAPVLWTKGCQHAVHARPCGHNATLAQQGTGTPSNKRAGAKVAPVAADGSPCRSAARSSSTTRRASPVPSCWRQRAPARRAKHAKGTCSRMRRQRLSDRPRACHVRQFPNFSRATSR
jgi:hypothetical protein